MDINNLVAKHKNKLINTAIIILALVVANHIFKIQSEKIKRLQEDKKNELRRREVLVAIDELENKLNQYRQDLARKDSSAVISSINELAKESGVSILSIKPDQEARLGDYAKVPFMLSLKAAGSHAIGKFISKLEANREVFYSVESLRIAPAPDGSGLTASLKLSSIEVLD